MSRIPYPLLYQVDSNDVYPQQMCSQCWKQFNRWSDFKELARDSERQLKLEKEQEHLLNDRETQTVIVKEEMELEEQEEILLLKEEPVEYLEGHSLAPDEVEKGVEDTEDPLSYGAEPEQAEQNEKRKSQRRKKSSGRAIAKKHKCGFCYKSFQYISTLKNHESYHKKMEKRLEIRNSWKCKNPPEARDEIGHFCEQRNAQRCKLCKNYKTVFYCIKCEMHLCCKKDRNCFLKYHIAFE